MHPGLVDAAPVTIQNSGGTTVPGQQRRFSPKHFRRARSAMLFQTAGIEVAPWIPPLVVFTISFFTSMGGVSGAFLLLPFQMSFLGSGST
jgi:hypothetical protein